MKLGCSPACSILHCQESAIILWKATALFWLCSLLAALISRKSLRSNRDHSPGSGDAWADQLLDALIYLHSRDRQVIHRDIKPHNLKLTATGQIALLDFGLAKAQASDPSVTGSQAFYGYTRHYAPLEQIQDQRTDPRSDIYALGATLYHLLTGTKPPDAMVRAAAVINGGADPLRPANQIHEAVGPQIAAILNKALAQKPEARYANANEFREALRGIGSSKVGEGKIERKAVGHSEQASASETIHISEISSRRAPAGPILNMALVGSAKRFGLAGATAVLAPLSHWPAGILSRVRPMVSSANQDLRRRLPVILLLLLAGASRSTQTMLAVTPQGQ